MDFTLNRENFVKAVGWVSRKVDPNDTAARVVFSFSNGESHIYYESSSIFLRSNLDCTIDSGEHSFGADIQDVKNLAAAVGFDSGVELKFQEQKDGSYLVKSGNNKYSLHTTNPRRKTSGNIKKIAVFDGEALFSDLQRLSKLCDTANAGSVPAVGCVNVVVKEDQLEAAASDRYAFAVTSIKPESVTEWFTDLGVTELMIPAEIAALIKPTDEQVTLLYSPDDTRLGYSFANGDQILYSLDSASRLAYEPLIKKSVGSVTSSFHIGVADLKNAIQQVDLMDRNNDDVTLNVDKKQIIVSDSHNSSSIVVAVSKPDEIPDGGTKIKFNRAILRKALGAIPTKSISFGFKDGVSPVYIQPVLDDGKIVETVQVLVMPYQK